MTRSLTSLPLEIYLENSFGKLLRKLLMTSGISHFEFSAVQWRRFRRSSSHAVLMQIANWHRRGGSRERLGRGFTCVQLEVRESHLHAMKQLGGEWERGTRWKKRKRLQWEWPDILSYSQHVLYHLKPRNFELFRICVLAVDSVASPYQILPENCSP